MTNNVPAKAVVGDHEIEGDIANVTSLDDTTKQGGFDKDDGGRNLNKGPSDTKEPVDSLNTDFTDKTTDNDEQQFVPPVMKGKGLNTEEFVEALVQTLKTESEKVIDFSDMKAVLESSSDNAEFIESAFDSVCIMIQFGFAINPVPVGDHGGNGPAHGIPGDCLYGPQIIEIDTPSFYQDILLQEISIILQQ